MRRFWEALRAEPKDDTMPISEIVMLLRIPRNCRNVPGVAERDPHKPGLHQGQ